MMGLFVTLCESLCRGYARACCLFWRSVGVIQPLYTYMDNPFGLVRAVAIHRGQGNGRGGGGGTAGRRRMRE